MPQLHDAAFRQSIEARLASLRPDAARRWGRMTSAQMLWHVNQFLAFAIGEQTAEPARVPLPRPIFRLILLYLPWPKSAPTNPDALAKVEHDFAAEHARCTLLIGRFANRPIDGPWPADPTFGRVTGRYQSRLQAKHLDHHLRQFGC
jgi:hypothetical protein